MQVPRAPFSVKLSEYSKKGGSKDLKSVQLGKSSRRIVLFTDALFHITLERSLQAGSVIFIADGDPKSKVLYYNTSKCSLLTRRVVATKKKLLASTSGFYHLFGVEQAVSEALRSDLQFGTYIFPRTEFSCVSKFSSTLKNAVQIDAAALQESILSGELRFLP